MTYRYQAFLSYSSKDAVIVKELHRMLETYRIPMALVGRPGRGEDPIPKRLFPIFRDRDELPLAADLGSTLQDALKTSRCLVVFCSPNAAKSRWVDEEIRFFKLMGREDRIFAIICDGIPNGSDSTDPAVQEQECFPPSLRHHLAEDGSPTGPRTEPIGGDLRPEGDGKQVAFLKTVAGIIGVGYDALAQRELRRKRRDQRIMAGVVGIFILMGLAVWDYTRTKVSYYSHLVDVWGVPQGYFPLSGDALSHRSVSLRVASSRGLVRLVERVNSQGQLVDDPREDSSDFGAAIEEVHYDADGHVSKVILSDSNHQVIMTKDFNERKDLTQTVGFQGRYDDEPVSLNVGSDRNEVRRKTAITARKLTFNENGHIARVDFLDIYHTPAPDDSGVYTKVFHDNDAGLPDEVTFENADGNPAANQDGVAYIHQSYDAQGNLIEIDNYDTAHHLTKGPNGYCKVVYTVDSYGRETQADFFDAEGRPMLGKESFARMTSKFDDHGNVIERAFFGLNGDPILNLNGEASITNKYDERGNKVEYSYNGVNGEPVLNKERFHRSVITYDDNNFVIQEDFFGLDNQLTIRAGGFARRTFKTEATDKGHKVEIGFFGTDGNPRLDRFGKARMIRVYDERGNLVEWDYFGLDGQPILTHDPRAPKSKLYAKLTYTYDARGNVVMEKFFGLNGEPYLSSFNFSSRAFKYDEQGNRVEQDYLGLDGQLITTKWGYAKIVDKFNDRGDCIERAYFDPNGQPTIYTYTGAARVVTDYDALGKVLKITRYNLAGQALPDMPTANTQ